MAEQPLDAVMTDDAPAPGMPNPAAGAAEARRLRHEAFDLAKDGLSAANLSAIIAKLRESTVFEGGVVEGDYDDLPKPDVPENLAHPRRKITRTTRGSRRTLAGA